MKFKVFVTSRPASAYMASHCRRSAAALAVLHVQSFVPLAVSVPVALALVVTAFQCELINGQQSTNWTRTSSASQIKSLSSPSAKWSK